MSRPGVKRNDIAIRTLSDAAITKVKVNPSWTCMSWPVTPPTKRKMTASHLWSRDGTCRVMLNRVGSVVNSTKMAVRTTEIEAQSGLVGCKGAQSYWWC